jgi:broad specificity phosphatase PhoE
MGLYEDQQSALALLPPEQGVVLLTRHSVREEANNQMPGFDVPLTPEGVTLAEEWGQRLSHRTFRQVYSSQSPRCVDTGAAMLRGAQVEAGVELVDLLREPGCYVEQMKLAGPVFQQRGPLEFVNRILKAEVPGIFPVRKATLKVLNWIGSVQPNAGQITVCVTHDTILGTFIHDLIGAEKLADSDWPWMMEGAFLWCTEDRWSWIWRGMLYQKLCADL